MSVYFMPLHFWLVPPHFGCSGDGTGQVDSASATERVNSVCFMSSQTKKLKNRYPRPPSLTFTNARENVKRLQTTSQTKLYHNNIMQQI